MTLQEKKPKPKTKPAHPKDLAIKHYQSFLQSEMHDSIGDQNKPQIIWNNTCPLQGGRESAAQLAHAREVVKAHIFVAVVSGTSSFMLTAYWQRESRSQVSFSLPLEMTRVPSDPILLSQI